jgi:hypothetical protein
MPEWDEENAHRKRRSDKTYASRRLASFGGAPTRNVIKTLGNVMKKVECEKAMRQPKFDSRSSLRICKPLSRSGR